MKNTKKYTVHVENGKNGLDLYLARGNEKHYVTTRRANGLLWLGLKNGVSVEELRKFKPKKTDNLGRRSEQRYYKQTRYILRLLDDFIDCELAA